jgi:ankyrin repeat protein
MRLKGWLLEGMIDYARTGDLEQIERLLSIASEEEINLITRPQNGGPFKVAIEHGHLMVVRKFLQYPAVINNSAVENNMALRLAASYGHLSVVQELLTYKTVVDNIAAEDNEALRLAASGGHLSVVQELLTHAVVVNNIAVNNNCALR